MDPIKFLHGELEMISKSFPKVSIRFGYNHLIESYVVELLPQSEFDNNSDLDDKWIPLSFKFRESFPTDEIVFVSEDSQLMLSTLLGEFNLVNCDFELYEPLMQKELELSFSNFMLNAKFLSNNSYNSLLNCPKQTIDLSQDLEHSYQQAA